MRPPDFSTRVDTYILPDTDSFPILECAAHPHPCSVFGGANKVLWKCGTELTGQWHTLIAELMEHWIYDDCDPPRWFTDASVLENAYDNVELSPSQASGYAPELLV